jgi:hypothetical protein
MAFKQNFIKKYKKKLLDLDTDFELIEVINFDELNKYTYRNKQNFSNFILKMLNQFKIIDVVIIGSFTF